MTKAGYILESVDLMLPNIPRVGEHISIHNLFSQAIVTKVNNIYHYSESYDKDELIEDFTIIPLGGYHFHITVIIDNENDEKLG